jgi:hypothetical protein
VSSAAADEEPHRIAGSAMLKLQHSIRKQTLHIETESEALALALQPRVSDINRRYFLPVIERLLIEFSVPGRQIKIVKLDVDLGELPFARFAEAAAERLDQEFRRALIETLRQQDEGPTVLHRSQPEQTSHLELFEHYLLRGTLPFWAPHAETLTFEEMLLKLAADDPAGLIAMITKHGRQKHVLERLVLQLAEATLQYLVRLLEPEHARLIIAYLLDLRNIHHVEPVFPVSDKKFSNIIWVVVLSYVVEEPGSQFNRRSFVKGLFQKMARSEGLEYTQIMAMVHRGLQETQKRRSLDASLTAVISELVQELNPDTRLESATLADTSQAVLRTEELRLEPNASPDADHRRQLARTSRLKLLEHCLLHDTLPFRALHRPSFSFAGLVAELAGEDPSGLVALIRKHPQPERVLERLVLQLGETLRRRLLQLLAGEHAELMVAYLTDLRKIHGVQPLGLLGAERFTRRLWLTVLSYALHAPASQFDRKSFVRSLLQSVARSEGREYGEILEMVRLSAQADVKNGPLESSLVAVITELAGELDEARFREKAETKDNSQTLLQALASDFTNRTDDAGDRVGDAVACLDFYLSMEQETDRKAWLDHNGRRGLLPYLAVHDPSRTRQLIVGLAARSEPGLPSVVHRLLQAFPPVDLLAVLANEHGEFITRLIAVVCKAGAQAPHAGLVQPDTLGRALWQTALDYLLREPAGRWDRRIIVCQVVEVGAERFGVSPGSLAGMAASALGRAAGTVEASLAQSIERLARTLDHRRHQRAGQGRPAQAFFARYDQVEVLRYYLRYGVLPWSALLRDPDLTAGSAIAALPELPRSLLSHVFAGDHADDQLRVLLRAVRMMPEECLERLLLRLYPQLAYDDSPFRLAVSAFAAQAEDKHVFYAQFLAATLNGDSLDLEQLAASALVQVRAAAPVRPADPARWEAHAQKSAIANQLRFGKTARAGGPTLAVLLHALIATHPEDARNFCRALRSTPGLAAELIRHCNPALFDRLLELLCPGESATLRALLQKLSAIPVTYLSCSAESMREVIFDEVIRLEEGKSRAVAFLFARVIRKLFATPLHEEVRQWLLPGTAAWTASVELPIAQVNAFASSIAGSAQEQAPSPKSPVLRDEVLAILDGERFEPNVPGNRQKTVGPRGPALLSDDAFQHALIVTLENYPEEIYASVMRTVENQVRREHWAETLPETALARLTYLLEPRMHRTLLDAAEVLASAWPAAAPSLSTAFAGRKLFWTFLLEFFARTTAPGRSVKRLVEFFFEYTAVRCHAALLAAPDRLRVGTKLLEHAGHLANAGGRANLHAILQRNRNRLLSSWEGSSLSLVTPTANLKRRPTPSADESGRPHRRSIKTAFSMPVEPDDEVTAAPIYIDNAGLVLSGPFLPHLFQTLDWLDSGHEGRAGLRDHDAISRAVHLLQYLVDGRTSAPEPLLVLNKILCGVPPSAPIAGEIEPTDREREICERLLRAMIENWKSISNTSIAGLQETFLQRDGRLERSDEGWKLRVQRKTVDVLVDQIPWSISLIYHRWMPQPLYVEW